MGTTRWHQERRREHFHRRAKKEGYRARSAYKLKQIDKRFRLLRSGMSVADLGCAPGGWSQVLAERVGEEGLVVGVDLQRTRPIPGVRLLRGDFTKPETHARLAAVLEENGRSALDLVVSDMSPDLSGQYELDQARSVHLCEMALQAARQHLRPGGAFVCKVFEGADFPEFRLEVKRHFGFVRTYRPEASRKQSSEVYLVAMGFRPEGGQEGPAGEDGKADGPPPGAEPGRSPGGTGAASDATEEE